MSMLGFSLLKWKFTGKEGGEGWNDPCGNGLELESTVLCVFSLIQI